MIIRTLTEDYKGSTDLCRNPYANQLPSSLRCSLSIPIYLQYVWEKANSRQCLLEFLLNIEKELQQPIIAESVADLRNSSSDLYKNWTNPLDIDERITEEDLKKAVNYLCSITNSEMKVKIDHEGMSPGLALEIVAASIASLKLSIKAPIKLGKYQYLNGKAKPDCVEVVVRELIEGLIYGK